jgi:pseudouridine-5'-monophosphatase
MTCVIFDLDGTLLDTEHLYTVAAEIVCSRHGATYTIDLKRRIMGGDTKQGARIVVETLALPITPEQYVEEREPELLKLLPSAAPMPGAEELVEQLLALPVALAIATSGHRRITELKLRQHSFLAPIRHVVCGDDPELTHPKPAPDIFLLAARRVGAEAGGCVVLEDSVNGVRAGVAAGMRTIALVDPRWDTDERAFEGAYRIVRSLDEIRASELLPH